MVAGGTFRTAVAALAPLVALPAVDAAQTSAVVAGELGQAFDAYMQQQAGAGFAGSMIVVKIQRRPV